MKISPLRKSDIPALAKIVARNYSKKWEPQATAELKEAFRTWRFRYDRRVLRGHTHKPCWRML